MSRTPSLLAALVPGSFLGTSCRRFSALAALALLLSLGSAARLAAQGLDYVDHLSLTFPHDAILPSNISLYDDIYRDAEGNLIPLAPKAITRVNIWSKSFWYFFGYDSTRFLGFFPNGVPFEGDVALSTGSEVSYSQRTSSYPPGTSVPNYQLAYMTGTRNSLYLYNLTSRKNLYSVTLNTEADGTLFRPADAMLAWNDRVFVSTNGGVYYLGSDELSIGGGALTPLITAHGSGTGELNNPSAFNVGPDGFLYVLDYGNDRIQSFDLSTGAYHSQFSLAQNDPVTGLPITVFPNSLAISHEGHIYLGDGLGGGSVFSLNGELLDTFHPPVDDPSWVDGGLIGPVGATSFLFYDGYGNVFTYVEGKGLFLYRDPTYPLMPYGSLAVTGVMSTGAGESIYGGLAFSDYSELTVTDTVRLKNGELYVGLEHATLKGGSIVTDEDVIYDGGGRLIIESANTYTTTTIVKRGELTINGSIAGDAVVGDDATLSGKGVIGGSVSVEDGGRLTPGDYTGLLTIKGNLTFSEFSTLLMQIDGTGAGLFDQLAVQGTFTADGTLDIELVNGYVPAIGDSFQLFTGGGYQSGFFTHISTNLGDGLTWDTSQLATMGIVTVVPEPAEWGILLGVGVLAIAVSRRKLRFSR